MHFFRNLTAALSATALAPFLYAQEEVSPAADAAATQTVVENTPADAPAPVAVPAAPETPAPEAAAAPENSVPENSSDLTDDQKKQLEIKLLSARKARIDAEVALERVLLSEKLSQRSIERSRIEAETALRAARTAEKLAEIDANKQKLDAETARDNLRDSLASLERRNKLADAELSLKIAQTEQALTIARYNREIARVKTAETLRGLASDSGASVPVYRKDPLENGKLYISDRRIEFDGVVTPELANYVAERIYLFNNQNTEYPIFIVIGGSPGGSVMSGYQILKAMESSKAPVYVVVKNFAASMAAVITTLADRSFCYSGAVLLHHQPISEAKGNLTRMRETLDATTAWTRLISDRVAAKLEMTYDEFVKEMYAHNSEGNWSEFGDGAQKLHWITDVVDTIAETSVVSRAVTGAAPARPNAYRGNVGETKIDERGKPYVELPSLQSGDAWMIYDPANFYRESI